jgi:tetratricopeptide (TPR) repeat protein
MKPILFLITFFLAVNSASAQSFIKLNEQFISLFEKGDYKAALPVGLKAVQQAKTEFGEASEHYAIAAHNVAEVYYKLYEYNNALPFYKRAVKAYQSFFKTNNESSALCNNSIGNIFLVQKKYDSAAISFEKAFSFFISNPKEQYDNIIVLMNNFTTLYLPTGKYREARIIYEKVLPVIESKEGTVNNNYCITLSNLGTSLYNLQEYVLAESYLQKGIHNVEKLKGINNTEYTDMLDMLGNCFREQGKFTEAETVILQSLKIKQAYEVQDSVSLAYSYGGLANLYGDLGAYNKAFEYYNLALSILDKKGMRKTADFFTMLRSFAYTCISGGRLADAKKLLLKALELQTKEYGSSYAINGEVLISLGNTEAQMNELSAAEAHAKEGLAIIIKNYSENNYAAAMAKEILGLVYHKLGNSNKGILLFKQAVVTHDKIFGESNKNTASVLSNLGLVYQELGNFAEAEIVLSKSLDIRKKIFGNEHPDYAITLCNLAMINVYQARYAQADQMLAEALNIYTKKELFHTNNFISLINNIAFMAGRQGDYTVSKKLFLRLLEILQTNNVKNTAALYLVFNNLSVMSIHQEQYNDALSYALKAMEQAKASQGIRSLEYIKSANNSIVAYRKMGNITKAREQSKELIPLCEEVMGKDANMLSILYFNTAMMENSEQNSDKAVEYLDKALTIYLNGFKKNFYTLSEKEKLTWWQDQSYHFAMFPSFLQQWGTDKPNMVSSMVNHQLQLKGLVLNDGTAALRKARASGNTALQKLIDEWQFNRTLLAKQLSMPVAERFYSTDSLELVANNLEKNINQQASGIINIQQQTNNNWQAIQTALKAGEAAVEFVRFPFYRNGNYTDTMQYAAIIIRKDKAAPDFVLIGNEAQINWCLTGSKDNNKEARIGRLYRSSLSSKNTGSFAGDSLYKLVWQPLMPYLQTVQTVLYAPDGLLHKVAFHALPVSSSKLLIDSFHLQQYSSIRQVIEKGTTAEKWNTVFMMGNADFNSSVQLLLLMMVLK